MIRRSTGHTLASTLALSVLAVVSCKTAVPQGGESPSAAGAESSVLADAPAELDTVAPRGDDAFAQHLEELRETLPDGFHAVPSPPFVVLGDESQQEVEEHARRTVAWAVTLLKKDFFEADPDEFIDIWLFKDAESYVGHARELFGDEPSTPYGYYTETHHALLMNIATGGGTLVHELVHPFMDANFPACPSWLNEGLASLFEQCGEVDGHVVGRTNWRLEGLQDSIAAGTLPSFEALTKTTTDEFYASDTGYAQARYLCYFLQEQGKLIEFFQEFRANVAEDPTGYATLQRVLEVDDMVAFQAQWEAHVMALKFP